MRATKTALRDMTDVSARRRVWRLVVDHPLWSHAYYLLDPDVRHLRLRRDTDLVIEGFPRSANTYAAEAIRLANPGLSLTHHLHQPRIVERAVARGIPTLLLIREPDATAASFAAFAPKTPVDEIYASYIYYYERLMPLVDKLVVADFTEITAELDGVLAAINDRYGVALKSPEKGHEPQVFKHVDAFSRHYFGDDDFDAKVSRPSSLRPRVGSPLANAPSEARERAAAVYRATLDARRPLHGAAGAS